jgi:hypothetical protein
LIQRSQGICSGSSDFFLALVLWSLAQGYRKT